MKEQLYQLFQSSSAGVSVEDLALRVLVSVVLGLAIFVSYWISHAGTIYSQKFNINLITLTVLTATVMTVIGNNIALSLGMVGALSIVRFRTAIKEPLDIAFLFWAIAIGIVLAAAALVAGICAAAWLASGQHAWMPSAAAIASTVVAVAGLAIASYLEPPAPELWEAGEEFEPSEG